MSENQYRVPGSGEIVDLKYLYNRISELEGTIERMKRTYEDLLYNLDFDNLEPVSTRKPLKYTIEEVFPDGTKGMSSIESNAKEIRTEVKQVYAIKEYDGRGTPGNRDRGYVWKNVGVEPNVYYVYNELEEDWVETRTNELKTAFIQTSDGFKFDGTVKINGNLITEGTISGVNIHVDTDAYVGNNLYIGEFGERLEEKFIRFTQTANIRAYDDSINVSAQNFTYGGKKIATESYVNDCIKKALTNPII